MPHATIRPQLRAGAAALAGAVAANAALGLAVWRAGAPAGLLLGLLPAALVALGALVASDRSILVFGALGLGMSFHALNVPLPVGGSGNVFGADVLVALALGSTALRRLTSPPAERRSPGVRFAALGWPFALFAPLVLVATVRGHELYGERLFGEPLRLVLYAGIALALLELDARKAYRGLVAVYYAGTVWMLLNSAYFIATGTSQTSAEQLSTGGDRYLSISVSFYLAGALFLALLNLELDRSARRRGVHLAIAALATLGIVLAFSRGTFLAVALVVPAILLGRPRVRSAVLGFLPLALPFVVVGALALSWVAPSVWPTLLDRVNITRVQQGNDPSVEWRVRANEAILRQFRQSPLLGVGFGKGASFTLDGVKFRITQNPHDSFVWLLAGGGATLLASFAAVVLAYARDARRRYRQAAEGHQRVLIAWSAAMLANLLLNAAAGPLFSSPTELLMIWVLLLLPGIVRVGENGVPARPALARS